MGNRHCQCGFLGEWTSVMWPLPQKGSTVLIKTVHTFLLQLPATKKLRLTLTYVALLDNVFTRNCILMLGISQ